MHDRRRVLWVGFDPPTPCDSLEVIIESDVSRATQRASEDGWDAVVVEAADVQAVAKVLGAVQDGVHRIAAASYGELPELVRVVDEAIVDRVLAAPVDAGGLDRVVCGEDPSASVIARRALDAPEDLSDAEVDERLRALIARIVDIPTAVIRPIAPNEEVPTVQLVVPADDAVGELQRDLPRLLGRPLKAGGSAMGKAYRKHPLREILGRLCEAQEVYCLGRDDFAYVACFPWQGGSKLTFVIGGADPGSGRVGRLHEHAVAQAVEFPLPSRHRQSPLMFYDPDYDWVITRNYVGPDRRRKRTTFLNRYTFWGRRKALIPNEFRSAGTFVDGAPRWAWLGALAFLLLFAVDTGMTAHAVGSGSMGELNPVMRWALQQGLGAFLITKTLIAVAVMLILLRWHLWRPGRWIFGACLLVYVAIDVNWLLLALNSKLG